VFDLVDGDGGAEMPSTASTCRLVHAVEELAR